MSKSTEIVSASKPAKPYPEFPIFAMRQSAGRRRSWERLTTSVIGTIRKRPSTGTWPIAIDLHAGRVPTDPSTANGHTVADLCNSFMIAKDQQRDTGEISDASGLSQGV